jgi:hypothetical protein
MPTGRLTISVDLELAWGWWDILTPEIVYMAETAERRICGALLELFDRYRISATWGVVAGVLDEASASERPGSKRAWFAPEIVEQVMEAKAGHEIGSHSGRHVEYGRSSAAEVQADLEFAKATHLANGLAFDSFMFPRNSVGHLDLVARAGIRVVRGPDTGWVRAADRAPPALRRLVTFADKLLPLPPSPARAQQRAGLIDIPGSMLLPGRNGLRRFIMPWVSRAKMAMGLARAQRTGGTFHLWFHPSNFYYRGDEQLATLAWFLARAADEAGRGKLEIRTMGSYAGTDFAAVA